MGRILKASAAPVTVRPVSPSPAPVEASAAFEAARREGLAAGRAEAAAEAALLLAEARAEAARALAAVEPAALAIARKMAEKIVGRAVALDPATMADIAAEAMSTCRPDAGPLRLRVHPDDLAAVQAGQARLAARGGSTDIELVADPTVGRHGCVIDTPRGRIDARLDAQLDALERAARGEERDV